MTPTASAGGVTFTDIAANDGAGVTYRRAPSPESVAIWDALKQQPIYEVTDLADTPIKSRGAPGVALLDFDRDGDLDIYVTNGPGANNSLYSNQLIETGAVTFVDLAVAAGVGAFDQDSTGVCFGDIDNDGDHDLMVLGNLEPNRLFENEGDGTFTEITATSGVGVAVNSSSACSMGDIDGDGLLDIAVSNTFDMRHQRPIFSVQWDDNQPNQLLHNLGGNVFADVTASSGFLDLGLDPGAPADAATISWDIAMVDLDLDGDIDIMHGDDNGAVPPILGGFPEKGYVQLFEGDGAGSFTNTTLARGLDVPGAWMGLSYGDFNHDGRMDLFCSNFGDHGGTVLGAPFETLESRVFTQQPDGTFVDHPGLGTPFGWGTSAVDYDNDGDTDVIMHGGIDQGIIIITSTGTILENDGAGNFARDAVALAGSTDHVRRNVMGVATGDLDNDGFVDVVSVSNFDFPPPIPMIPAPELGGEFDADAFYLENFTPLDPDLEISEATEFVFTGLQLPDDGTLSVELSNGENHNRSLQVELLGTIGITSGGRVNRDGIGAVIRFTPNGGDPVLHPVLGGSSHASQDSLIATLGMDQANKGMIDVLWPGGVRNRLTLAKAGARILFPEIPCSYDDPDASFVEYTTCVHTALGELRDAGVLSASDRGRFLSSAIVAYIDAH